MKKLLTLILLISSSAYAGYMAEVEVTRANTKSTSAFSTTTSEMQHAVQTPLRAIQLPEKSLKCSQRFDDVFGMTSAEVQCHESRNGSKVFSITSLCGSAKEQALGSTMSVSSPKANALNDLIVITLRCYTVMPGQ